MDTLTSDPVAIVTGGTRNIGYAISRKLVDDGFIVVANYLRDEASAQAALDELKIVNPYCLTTKADVSTEDGAEYLINKVLETYGRIDALVNNVGPFLVKDIVDMTPYEWQSIIEGNLSSSFYCSHYALPIMRERQDGRIVNIAAPKTNSTHAMGAYGIAKTGAVMLAKYIAKTEGKNRIRANAVCPGFILTDVYSEAEIEKWTPKIPLGRFGLPNDIAEAVSFLLSDKADYITGAVLDVTGGAWL